MPARTTTHIAGPSVCYNGRMIQRCVVCGLKLVDVKTDMGGPFGPGCYAAMTLVREKGSKNGATMVLEPAPPPKDGQMPEDNCFSLVEESWR